MNRTPTVGSALTVVVESGEIESIEYLADGSSLRATVYGELSREVQVKVSGIRDAGNKEMEGIQILKNIFQILKILIINYLNNQI